MTPLGHAAVSYLAGRGRRISLLAVLAGGLLVDVDLVLLPFAAFNAIHRVITHNIFFVGGLALLAALLFPRHRGEAALGVLLGGLLHLLADSMIDSNPTNGIGVALLWPLNDVMVSPINLIPAAYYTTEGWHDLTSALRHLWLPLLIEVPFWIGAGLLLSRDRDLWAHVRRSASDGQGADDAH